ncbi:MAG: thioredoxin family protein [Acidobacteriota bacterium]
MTPAQLPRRPRGFAYSAALAALLAVAAGGPLAYPAGAETNTEPKWHDRVEEALAEARSTDRLILVDLYAEWCGWCKKLEKDVFSTTRFAQVAENYVLLRVDVEDAGEGMRLQDRFDARNLPTTLIIDADLVRIGTIRGYFPAPTFVTRIDAQVARWQKFMEGYRRDVVSEDPQVLRSLAEALRRRSDGARAAAIYRRLLTREDVAVEGEDWLRLLLADSLRLSRDFAGAAQAVADFAPEDPTLTEALSLFRVHLARDRQDCAGTSAAVDAFVAEHPTSRFRREARFTLSRLQQDIQAECAG